MNPVLPQAQSLVPVPENLENMVPDVDRIPQPGSMDIFESDVEEEVPSFIKSSVGQKRQGKKEKGIFDPYYINDTASPLQSEFYNKIDIDSIPIVELSIEEKPVLSASSSLGSPFSKRNCQDNY